MTLQYGKFEIPDKISVDEKTANATYARFIAEPFSKGFGHTLGNSIRRLLYNAIEAPAIIGIAFEKVPHEFTAIEGIVEDMINICLNLKGALLRKLTLTDDPRSREQRLITTMLDVSREDLDANGGSVSITLGDLCQDGRFEVFNPSLHLFTVTKPLKRQIDLRVAIGKGYVPSERHVVHDRGTNEILIDGCFSPVRLVNYFVENTRVGQDTDFDRLIIEVTTDGRVKPTEALSFASQIAARHFDVFENLSNYSLLFDEGMEGAGTDDDEILDKLCMRIDEMELSVRSTNCLRGAQIETIAELVSIPDKKMLEFKNFGKKSLTEIKAKLTEMGLYLGMDLSRFGITQDNVKEKMRQYQEKKRGRKDKEEAEEEYAEELE